MMTIFTWDLGATKCTAGLIEYNEATKSLTCLKHVTINLSQTDSLEHLIDTIENKIDFNMSDARAICIGAAGHYDGETLLLSNPYPYTMSFAKVAAKKQWPTFAIIHDYASIVCATFTSYMDHPTNIKHLNQSPINPYGRRVAFGLGTGLGLKDGVMFPDGTFWLGNNEGGLIGITHPPHAEQQDLKRHHDIVSFLEKKSKNKNAGITYEDLLTGKGLVNLYQFYYPTSSTITPETVGERMQTGLATEMVDTFAWYLGLFVGTIQLMFMPDGGTWITGGLILKHGYVLDSPDFFAGIYASPSYRAQREQFPLGVLCNNEHALIGCGYYALKYLV